MAEEVVDPSRLEAAQQFIQQEEGQGPRRPLQGWIGKLASAIAVGMSLLFLYWAWATVTAQVLRLTFLGLVFSPHFSRSIRRVADPERAAYLGLTGY